MKKTISQLNQKIEMYKLTVTNLENNIEKMRKRNDQFTNFANIKNTKVKFSNQLFEDMQAKASLASELDLLSTEQKLKLEDSLNKSLSSLKATVSRFGMCTFKLIPATSEDGMKLQNLQKEIMDQLEATFQLRQNEITSYQIDAKIMSNEVIALKKELKMVKMSHNIGKEQHKWKLEIKKLQAEKKAVEFQLTRTDQQLKQMRTENAVAHKKMTSRMSMDRKQWESDYLKLEEKMSQQKDDFERQLKRVQSNLKSVRSHNDEQRIAINKLNQVIAKQRIELSEKNRLVEKQTSEVKQLRRLLTGAQ